MSRKCAVTGKTFMSGNRMSHANNRSRHKILASGQKHRVYVPSLGRSVVLRLSARGLRTLSKIGPDRFSQLKKRDT